jgi:prefoldin subunit 5
LKLGSVSNSQWNGIIVETKFIPEQVDALETELETLNKEIKELVGNKMKRINEIRNELFELRKGPI